MMNPVLQPFYLIIQIIVWLLLLLPTMYIFLFAFAALFYRQKVYPEIRSFRKIAVLIPGYKEDDVIVNVAKDALNQDYPQEYYDVVIIADSFQPETISGLKDLPVRVIEVKFEKSTKSKALNAAMEKLGNDYDLAVVLDADNLMAADFLSKVNASLGNGNIAVQGHRTAKNMDTSLAVLDAASEEINNHIFRKGHRTLGLSSAIIGSGMAFQYGFFKTMMASVTAVGGFDKEIELKMLKEGYKIAYLDDALIYDEKVRKAEVFSNQRKRWLSAQLHYFRTDIGSAVSKLISEGNIDYFDKTIQFIQPPRVLLLGMVLLSSIFFFTMNGIFSIPYFRNFLWIALTAMCILAFLFSVPLAFYNIRTLKALLSLPQGMALMLGSLLKIRGANNTFIHTKHSANTVNK